LYVSGQGMIVFDRAIQHDTQLVLQVALRLVTSDNAKNVSV